MAKRKRRNLVAEVPVSDPPIRPGLQSPRRAVPAEIVRPPYIPSGDPGPSRSNVVRTPDELAAMRVAGRHAAEILLEVASAVRPGITTDELDVMTHELTIARGGYPSPLGYRGFPKSVCTSVNEVVCHGIPDSRPLADGDIINIDVTVYIEGVHGDTSVTVLVGDVDEHSRRLVHATREALYLAIDTVKPGAPFNAIGRAIERHAKKHQLGVVQEFIGHGVGTEFHTSLQIPHYYVPSFRRPMEEGMTFTIEPMLNLGTPDVLLWDDDWTAVTADGRRTAQFEHTLAVTATGVEILTLTGDGRAPADVLNADVAV